MKHTEKPKYNLWQNTAYMVKTAWAVHKPTLLGVAVLAILSGASAAVQLYLAPGVLAKIEDQAPLTDLLVTLALFTGALILVNGLRSYVETNVLFGRVAVRTRLMALAGIKSGTTSYPNTLDPAFLAAYAKAQDTLNANSEATEHIWTSWTEALGAILAFLVYLGALSGLNPLLALTVGLTSLAGFLVSRRASRWDHDHQEEDGSLLKELEGLNHFRSDWGYAKDIRIFGLGPWLEELYAKSYAAWRAFRVRRERVHLWTHVADAALCLARNGISYAYLLRITLEQGLSASEFLLYFTAATGFTGYVTAILEQFATLNQESIDLNALRRFLEWPEPFTFEGGLSIPAQAAWELKLEKVSYRYPESDRDTIRELSLTIRPGEKIAIVGLNGAGKTTLVKLLCGFLDPTRGRVLLNGQDIRQYNRREYYRLFSAVFQEFSLLSTTVQENITQVQEGADEARAWECLRQAGLEEMVQALPGGLQAHFGRDIYEDGTEFSGGQTQRLMLARALYKDAPILALDEPTAALDPLAENDIYLKYNQMTRGRTALFISHRLASTRFCDRILLLEQGEIAEEGAHDQLLAQNGRYAELFRVQSKYYQEGEENHG